jgi:hypothetical protein
LIFLQIWLPVVGPELKLGPVRDYGQPGIETGGTLLVLRSEGRGGVCYGRRFWLFRHLNGVEMLYGKFGNYKAAGEGYVNFSREIISAENAHEDLCAIQTGNTKENVSQPILEMMIS